MTNEFMIWYFNYLLGIGDTTLKNILNCEIGTMQQYLNIQWNETSSIKRQSIALLYSNQNASSKRNLCYH